MPKRQPHCSLHESMTSSPDIAGTLNRPERLRAVQHCGLIDTPPEECFDRLTRLAAEAVHAPAAFLSIVDERGDFYKSQFGFQEPLASARRMTGETFCHHTIVNDGLLVIDDARLGGHSQVPTIRTMGIVAYVGVPLRTAAQPILGAFCVIDTRPRAWSAGEVDTITLLARAAMREIESRTRASQAHQPAATATSTATLSPREREILFRILSGQRLKEIAFELNISVKTVSTHRTRLMTKLELTNNRDLFRYALQNGLLDWRSSLAQTAAAPRFAQPTLVSP